MNYELVAVINNELMVVKYYIILNRTSFSVDKVYIIMFINR